MNIKQKANIKSKYFKKAGVYMWINNKTKRCYIGSTNNLYSRMNNYLSLNYINKNKDKMAICSAIAKYNITNFTFVILELVNTSSNEIRKILVKQENFWFEKINPSYNIQAIIDPFLGKNHYRFGKTVSEITKEKISKSLLGRLRSSENIQMHILGARKNLYIVMIILQENL